jgi:predicted enzyme related to lactoylglutathione lyase
VAVGPQYDSTHVYVAPGDLDAFVASVNATFGGHASSKSATNVLPVPSSTEFQFISTPAGTLSVFAYKSPVPFPFGQERTGYLVTNMDEAIGDARRSGAEVIVEPFKDPIGVDAVIQWPGGMQLYWHFTPPRYAPLETIPDNRVYVSRDEADNYRRIRISLGFGNMLVQATDGHLPYPFGYEVTGYEVADISSTLAKARAVGVRILWGPYNAKNYISAIVDFPGGYIAEIHSTPATAPRSQK